MGTWDTRLLHESIIGVVSNFQLIFIKAVDLRTLTSLFALRHEVASYLNQLVHFTCYHKLSYSCSSGTKISHISKAMWSQPSIVLFSDNCATSILCETLTKQLESYTCTLRCNCSTPARQIPIPAVVFDNWHLPTNFHFFSPPHITR